MAALAPLTMGKLNENCKPIHPLFQRVAKSQAPPNSQTETQFHANPTDEVGPPPNQKLSTENTIEDLKNTLSPASKLSQSPLFTSTSEGGPDRTSPLEIDPNEGRRKRRKTASPARDGFNEENTGVSGEGPRRSAREPGNRKPYSFAPDIGIPLEKDTSKDLEGRDNVKVQSPSQRGRPKSGKQSPFVVKEDQLESTLLFEPPRNILNVSRNISVFSGLSKSQPEEKPKKILKFNPKTGTIGSPPTKKAAEVAEKSSKGRRKKSHLLTIPYGSNFPLSAEVGKRIEHILGSLPQIKTPTNKCSTKDPLQVTPTKNANSVQKAAGLAQPPKSLHPLFLGKAGLKPKPTAPNMVPKTNIVDLTTPTCQLQSRPKSPRPGPSTGFVGFGASSKALKAPGLLHPAWPWEGMVHIRGLDGIPERDTFGSHDDSPEQHSRKAKYSATQVLYDEDVLHSVAAGLDIAGALTIVKEVSMNDWPLPPNCLGLPTKHLESGLQVQQRVSAELHARLRPQHLDDSSEDELQSIRTTRSMPHPALTKLFEMVRTSLSAFDVGQCEAQAWIHKHSPKTALEVLQTGREAFILREWLQTLTVKSVESGLGAKAQATTKLEATGRRKRKLKKADNFIVSDDEELDDLDELTEAEDEIPRQGNTLLKKTVVRTGVKDSKLKNAVLISGPHGCGKTAAVYAVAKELGFEVFEINSSSRRSGKDIMEKVGDMTRNHLVQRQQNSFLVQAIDEDSQRLEQALADDIQSGRQGTMNSFFKLKDLAQPKPKWKKQAPVTTKETLTDVPLFKPPQKEQKQSLILIEEVDILYEEDKQFWNTVLNLIATSKRPIIMTCNDESLGPIDLDNFLHAIIRFQPPPIDLATDYMLLVAACEGHVLKRQAVKELYEGRKLDLRGSINELHLWCQFAVGDQKHGGDWYYQRQLGKDLDHHGRQIRVVSEGTYSAGLGWVSEDYLESDLKPLEVEEEMLQELWDGWGLDAGDWHASLPLNGWASVGDPKDRLSALVNYQSYVECLSISDVCSGSTFAPDKQAHFDTTHPSLPTRSLEDFPLGRSVLHCPYRTNHHPLAKHISIYLRSRARNILHADQTTGPLPPQTGDQIKALIRKHNTANEAEGWLTRKELSLAFDPISFPPTPTSLLTSGGGGTLTLEPSIFDRTLSIVTLDVAPYVRSILAYESRLQQARAERSGLLVANGGNGRGPKKARMTRSAMSALEGGVRSAVRRERWFDAQLNGVWVARTGSEAWAMATEDEVAKRRGEAIEAIQAAIREREAHVEVEVGVEGRNDTGSGEASSIEQEEG